MGYSPISKLYVKDFRNIGEVTIDFSQSPIIALVGDNESGKTSVTKAFGVLALHATPNSQAGYVRDGQSSFGVGCDLVDGTRIVRIKGKSGTANSVNSYKVVRPDGSSWSTNKLTEGLPKEVQDIMGLIEEPETGEYLHIRTYEDKLLFAMTANSVNYKMMYNALKVEQLTKAIKLGSTEANSIKSEINDNEVRIQTLSKQRNDIKVFDTEQLVGVKDRLKSQLEVLDKMEKIIELERHLNGLEAKLGALKLIDIYGLTEVNELLASKLQDASKMIQSNTQLKRMFDVVNQVDTLESIDMTTLNKLQALIEQMNNLDRKVDSCGVLASVSSLEEISESLVSNLSKLSTSIASEQRLRKMAQAIDTSGLTEITGLDILGRAAQAIQEIQNNKIRQQNIDSINKYVCDVNEYLKRCGVAVETCPKCGEAVVFDIDRLNELIS